MPSESRKRKDSSRKAGSDWRGIKKGRGETTSASLSVYIFLKKWYNQKVESFRTDSKALNSGTYDKENLYVRKCT